MNQYCQQVYFSHIANNFVGNGLRPFRIRLLPTKFINYPAFPNAALNTAQQLASSITFKPNSN